MEPIGGAVYAHVVNAAMTKALRDLVRGQTIGSLGTLHDGEPFVSMVPYALHGGAGFLIHVSALSSHTSDMRAHPRVSLLVVAPESTGVPPQARARITVQGTAHEIRRSDPDHDAATRAYLARFPQSAPTFELADFSLFRIQPSSIRFVGGFAQAATLTPEAFEAAAGGRDPG
jgi:heme oxygenase (biliverdin-IX-beta and delta-forming)